MRRLHPYATDSGEREVLPYWFAGIGLGLTYLVYALMLKFGLTLPWFLDAPTPFAFYGLIRLWFVLTAWRSEILRRLGIVRIPDLNGIYEGWLTSSHDGHRTKRKCEIQITQTWTDICIRGEFEDSTSYNLLAGMTVQNVDRPGLTYQYQNEPRADAPQALHPHPGTVWFDVITDPRPTRLVGEYYTGRGRETFGTIDVRRTG